MGGIFGGGKTKQTTESSSSSKQRVVLPDYLQGVFPDIINRANELSLQPYQPYQGQRIADLTPDQLQAFEGIRGMQGMYSDVFDQAIQGAQGITEGLTPDAITRYMNPYIENVVDIGKREALRDFDVQMNNIGDLAANIGSFGGDRHAILESEAFRDVGQRLDDITQTGYASAYDQAVRTALEDLKLRGTAAQNLAQIGTAGQGYQLRDLAALEQIGATQQALDQAGLDFDYQQFTEQRAWPYEQLNFLTQTALPIGGLTAGKNTSSKNSETTTSKKTASPLSSIVGLASIAGAPFTGGTSLFGGIGSSLGSMFGSGIAQGTITAGMGGGLLPAGALGTPSLANFAAANNPFGYKEGGKVKKRYAEGGVTRLGRGTGNPLIDFLDMIGVDEAGEMLNRNYQDTFGPDNVFQRDVGDSALTSLLKTVFGTGAAALQAPVAAVKEIESLGGQLTRPRITTEDLAIIEQNPELLESLDPEIRARYEEVLDKQNKQEAYQSGLEHFRDNILAEIANDPTIKQEQQTLDNLDPETKANSDALMKYIGLPSNNNKPQQQQQPKEKEQNIFKNPLFQFGISMLQNSMDPLPVAAGKSLQGMSERRIAEEGAEAAAIQQQFENQLASMDMFNKQRLSNIQEGYFNLKQLTTPLEMQKTQAEIISAMGRAGNDPMKQKAVELAVERISSDPSYFGQPLGPVVDEMYVLLLGEQSSGTPSTSQNGPKRILFDSAGNIVQ